MHILLIITDYGSFNNFLSDLAVSLIERGDKIDVICSDSKIIDFKDRFNYKELGINIHFTLFPRGFNPVKQYKASVKIFKLVQSIQPDIIHINFTTGIFTSIFYKKFSQYTIGTIHGLGYPMVSGLKKYIFKAVEYFCFSRLNEVWVLNNFDYQLLLENRIKNVYLLKSAGLGCDISRFDINKFVESKNSIRESLNITAGDFVITFTGRFVHFKGYDLVLRAFMELKKLRPNEFKLLLIGEIDPIHPTGLTSEEEHDVSMSLDIVRVGFTNEVEKYLSITDVFAFPSQKEGMPVCIIEALAMGVPVITSDSRGCNDLISHNINGLLLSPNPSVHEIINAITILKDAPEIHSKLKQNALNNRDFLSRQEYIRQQIQTYEKQI